MAPACPPSIPANLHQTLSLVRSQVFQTVYNPTGARIGTKYLRNALKGPRITTYYLEPTPAPKKFNTLLKEREKRLEEKWLSRGGDKREAERWRLEEQIAPGYAEVMNKPEAWGVEGPMWDPREEYRKSKIEFRKSIGKGRPAKGELARWIVRRAFEEAADAQVRESGHRCPAKKSRGPSDWRTRAEGATRWLRECVGLSTAGASMHHFIRQHDLTDSTIGGVIHAMAISQEATGQVDRPRGMITECVLQNTAQRKPVSVELWRYVAPGS